MIQLIKKFIGEVLLTAGVALSIYNIFNFSYRGGLGGKQLLDLGQLPNQYEFEYVAYYYSQNTLLVITTGAILITIGIIIIKK